MAIFVTDNGFVKKTQAELITQYETAFKQIFGDQIDLDPDGPAGQFIAFLAQENANFYDGAQEIYTSRDPDKATGVSLDFILSENNLTRLPARPTQQRNAVLSGDEGTSVLAGRRAGQQDTELEYILDDDVLITKANALLGVISVTQVVVTNLNRITIDSVNYDYTTQGGDTETDILDELKILIDGGAWGGTVVVDPVADTLTLLDTSTFSFDVSGDVQIDDRGSPGDFTAAVDGANPLSANTLNIIVTPVTGWDAVNNPVAGETGAEEETDSEARARRLRSIIQGAATESAIRSGILDDVDDVLSAEVVSNRTNVTDGAGRPPKSFEAIVEGGDDDEIALKIWEKQPAGIESYGNTTVIITDSQGTSQTIKFSRPVNTYIHVQVKRDYNTEENYPADGDDLIKQAIFDWSLDSNNVSIGKDIIRQRLSTPVYTVPGIKDIEIELDNTPNPGDSPTFAAQNITVADNELAIFAIARITVLDLP